VGLGVLEAAVVYGWPRGDAESSSHEEGFAVEGVAMKLAETMRRDWDERARRNALFYVATWRRDWDELSFFASGQADYQRFVAPVLRLLAFDPSDKSMAEIGCGAGRMTRTFATHFQSVFAVDISEKMQTHAKAFLSSVSNITWVLTDGRSLSDLSNNSLDFVFSYLVLQHFPSRELVGGTIQEMLRTLKPGGAYLFQFNGSHQPTMNLKGRVLCAFLDTLASLGLKRLSGLGAQFAGIDPGMVGKTWRGVALSSVEIASMVSSAGGHSPMFVTENTPLSWCYGRKESRSFG
jgi:SAM-dependent methyltransferase